MNQIVPLQVIVLLIISVVCTLFSGCPASSLLWREDFRIFCLPWLQFYFKVFPTKSRVCKVRCLSAERFKSSAVAGIYVDRFCDMASIAGIFPFLLGLLSVSHLVFLVLLRVKHYSG